MSKPMASALIRAREARMLSQTALAKKMGVTQSFISKIENEQQEFTGELAIVAGEALSFPSSFFSREQDYRSLPVSFFRSRVSLRKTDIRRISAQVNILRMQLKTLLRSVEPPPLRVPSVDLAEFEHDAEGVARELRIRWHIPPGPIPNMTKILEDAGVLVMDFDFGTRKLDAISMYEPNDDLPPVIFQNPEFPGDRQRRTLAHELGHIVLHHHLPLPGPNAEEEADQFASGFLMPADDIRGQLTGRLNLQRLASLKLHWMMSIQTLVMRAFDLGIITKNQKEYLFIQIGKLGYRTREPVTIEREKPSIVREMVDVHLKQLGYSEDELRNALSSSVEDFRRSFGPDSSPSLRLV